MGLFKTKTHPVTGADIESRAFIHALAGNDISGNGTRSNPYATILKASAMGTTGKIFSGVSIETLTNSAVFDIIGDNKEARIDTAIGVTANYSGITNLTLESAGVIGCTYGCRLSTWHVNIDTINSGAGLSISKYNFANLAKYYSNKGLEFLNHTILNFVNYSNTATGNLIKNSIIVNSIDLYNFSSLTTLANIPLFYNCLFRKATLWKWNGTTINTSSATDTDSLIAVLTAYGVAMGTGAAKTYFQAMFPASGVTNILFNCRVVDDIANPIFNRYDINGNPIDYTLKLDSNNIALTMSDTMSYVGCYQASAKTDGASPVLEFNAPVNVDAAGAEITGDPKLLVYPGDGKFQIGVEASTQVRNRCTSSNVVKFERGFTLTGFQSQMKSAMGSRFSFGKFQKYNTTDAPCLPMESLEVIPYDTINTPSATFPRFSAMFNDKCQMWYHTAGAKINQPILFSDLAGTFTIGITQEPSLTSDFLTEYGAWAVTNADMVSYLLSSKTGCALRNIPLYFAKIELNLNYYN